MRNRNFEKYPVQCGSEAFAIKHCCIFNFFIGRATAGLGLRSLNRFPFRAIGVRLSVASPRRQGKTKAVAMQQTYAACGLSTAILHANNTVCSTLFSKVTFIHIVQAIQKVLDNVTSLCKKIYMLNYLFVNLSWSFISIKYIFLDNVKDGATAYGIKFAPRIGASISPFGNCQATAR